ncbi:hypothetical protein K490DRAFT_68126 [Saccharata proteae CBS 121410]|uniref:Uncharacterized protein n=1 Tax=Saccharata proteae CBS 121410 TaxID=1314787 RepID=A0A9P4HSZ1_9PEZI|nr:hypothetical protein K490DRAFT_68126 [Saccharata proteae CBS 121410]
MDKHIQKQSEANIHLVLSTIQAQGLEPVPATPEALKSSSVSVQHVETLEVKNVPIVRPTLGMSRVSAEHTEPVEEKKAPVTWGMSLKTQAFLNMAEDQSRIDPRLEHSDDQHQQQRTFSRGWSK